MLTEHEELEIQEAIDAAEEAILSLQRAEDYLMKASRWGLVDILGGGPLVTLVKRNHMRSADEEMEQARNALYQFSRELNDVALFSSFEMDTSDILGFADFFFDNAITDFLVQNKIENAKAQVKEAIARVQQIQRELLLFLEEN